MRDSRRGGELLTDDGVGRRPDADAVARTWFLGALLVLALLVAAYQVAERWPGTWAATVAEWVPLLLVLALLPPLLLGVLHPFWLIGLGLHRLVQALRARGGDDAPVRTPFVDSRAVRLRSRLRRALTDSVALRLVVSGVLILAVHAAISGAATLAAYLAR